MTSLQYLSYTAAAYDTAVEKTEFLVNPTVKFAAEGIAGYVTPAGSYTDAVYDDSAWASIQLPAFGPDYVAGGFHTAPPPGTLVPATTSDARGSGHWVARMTVDFPDYALPPGCTIPSALPGEKQYVLRLTTDNAGDFYFDGALLVTNGNNYLADYSNSFLLCCTPGLHQITIDKRGDTATDFLDVAIAITTPMSATLVPPETPTSDYTITLHHVQVVDGNPAFDNTQVAHALYYNFPNRLSPSTDIPLTSSRDAVITRSATGRGEYDYVFHNVLFQLTLFFTVAAPLQFPTLAQTRARGKLLPPLHVPKPGPVPDGLLTPAAPGTPRGELGGWFVSPWDPAHGEDGFYNGCYMRLFRATTLIDANVDNFVAMRGPDIGPPPNRDDVTGMFLEVDVFLGPPGDPAHLNYDDSTIGQPWNHDNRWTGWGGTFSDGSPRWSFLDDPIPAGSEVWLLAQQWPNGEDTTLPFDPFIVWDPFTDMGAMRDFDTHDPLPFFVDPAAMTEIPLPVPSSLWGP